MNRLVLGHGMFEWTRDELLDVMRRGSRPWTESQRNPDRNIGVLPLGHAVIAKPTPYQDTDEQHPRDLWVLHKKPWKVVGFLDSILVAFVCHGAYLRDRLDGAAIFPKVGADGSESLSSRDSRNSN